MPHFIGGRNEAQAGSSESVAGLGRTGLCLPPASGIFEGS